MESTTFSGFVIDPAKCSGLSLKEKRELVHEVSRWADNAPEILQSWSRRELLQLICAEMGRERKFNGYSKPRMIQYLLKLVSGKKNGKRNDDKTGLSSSKNQNGVTKKRKKEDKGQFATDLGPDQSISCKKEQMDTLICRNLACRATLSPEDVYCKRCSCCICKKYDDNKDPSLWLVCSSDPPYCSDSCGMSCHLKCAFKHEKAGILKNGCYTKLDGSFYCVCCGKVNWLIGSWRKQLLIAKEARRVDVLCERLSLSHKILVGTERYKELHSIVNEAVKQLKKEVGALDKVSAVMARGIVNRLACGEEIQKLCVSAVKAVDFMLSGSLDVLVDVGQKVPGPQAFRFQFENISPSSIVVSLLSRDEIFEETIIGCNFWHRSSDVLEYSQEPTCMVLRPETRIMISGLSPSTEYYFKASVFSTTKELGKWETRCATRQFVGDSSNKLSTQNLESNCKTHGDFILSLKKEQETSDQPTIIQADSQRGSTTSSDKKQVPNFTTTFSNIQTKAAQFVSSNTIPPETPSKPDRPNNSPASSNKKEPAESDYEYCVKVIRWLECAGHMEKEFRVKFLTWFSLKSTAQERRVVSAFINVLIDDPASLVAQLIDAFMDAMCSKKPDIQKGFCTRLWH